MTNEAQTPPIEEQLDGHDEFEGIILETLLEKLEEYRDRFDLLMDEHAVELDDDDGQEGIVGYRQLAFNYAEAQADGAIIELDNQIFLFANEFYPEGEESPMITILKNEVSSEVIDGRRSIQITTVQLTPQGMCVASESMAYVDVFGEYDLSGGGIVINPTDEGIEMLQQEEGIEFNVYDDEDEFATGVNEYDFWTIMESVEKGMQLIDEFENLIEKNGSPE